MAHAAADLSVTIADFRFTPATLTIHAGDTVTWTNQGPSAHTATARDGSFDTGLLRKGQSASHTFTQPGTISYFCRVHPFMRGTIVVLPVAAKSTSPAPRARAGARAGAGGNASPAASGSAPSKRAALPMTGADIGLLALLGLILGGLGAGLRRVLHHH